MSSFSKKGRRRSIKEHNKERLEEVGRILEELDFLAVELIKYSIKEEKTINRDDIKKLAQDLTEMPIGDLEVSIIWSKINDFEKRANEIRKKGEKEAEETWTENYGKEGDNTK
jgi:hypothetical protein